MVVVDEDIDAATSRKCCGRCRRAWTRPPTSNWWTGLEHAARPPHATRQARYRDHTNSRAIFYAVRPWHWREKFPQVSRSERELRQQVVAKYRHLLPFPT